MLIEFMGKGKIAEKNVWYEVKWRLRIELWEMPTVILNRGGETQRRN